MTRPPRANYPSDGKIYHEARRPGYAHTIRLHEELQDMYMGLKISLGQRKSHTDVVRCLFEAVELAITTVLQSQEQCPVPENVDVGPSRKAMVDDPDEDVKDPDEDVVELGLLSSDDEMMPTDICLVYVICPFEQALEQALSILEKKGLRIEEVIHDDNASVDAILAQHNIMSSKDLWRKCKKYNVKVQRTIQDKRRSLNEGNVDAATIIAQVAVFSVQQLKDFCRENALPIAGIKLTLVQRVSVHLKLPEAGGATELSRMRPLKYPELATHDLLVTKDIHNAADHWAGDLSVCRTLPGNRRCVTENWGPEKERKFPPVTRTTVWKYNIARKTFG
ncbi:hypothetical protein R1sor_019273 [Riccia sorocarpa]|uniref:SAP domain-containing protein n=1 Tax=Riccia sorocarpa TaxID=122646 RepID=A0ABD3ID54_9MARC